MLIDTWPGFTPYQNCGLSTFSTTVINAKRHAAIQTVYWHL